MHDTFAGADGVNVVSTKGRVVESMDGKVLKGPDAEVKYRAEQIRQYVGQGTDGRPVFNNVPLGVWALLVLHGLYSLAFLSVCRRCSSFTACGQIIIMYIVIKSSS